jgi:hypothetical protein
MSVPLLHRKCNRCDYIYRSPYKPIVILQAHRYEAFRFKKSREAVFTGGPEHAIWYTWQLAGNLAIIYPGSRFFGHLDSKSTSHPVTEKVIALGFSRGNAAATGRTVIRRTEQAAVRRLWR